MSLLQTEQLRANEDWRRVLAAYVAEQSVQKSLDPEHEGWVRRIAEVDGFERSKLTTVHGRLIAYGLLHAQLAKRADGVLYRISASGREALSDSPTGDEE